MMDKKELRAMMLEKRKILTQNEVEKASTEIINGLLQLPEYRESHRILSYMPYGNEVDLLEINQIILDQGKSLCIPRVLNATQMDAVRVESLDKGLKKSPLGILEPEPSLEAVEPGTIDLVFVPGLAFDWKGNRLGHGKGYYDRYLEKCGEKAFLLGIAYSFQVFDSIPFEAYDKRVHGVITENRFFLT